MKEERSGGELFYSFFITVYSTLTAALMDTHTQSLTGAVLSPTHCSCLAYTNNDDESLVQTSYFASQDPAGFWDLVVLILRYLLNGLFSRSLMLRYSR